MWSCELSSKPVVVTELTGGRTNRSFLLDAGGNKLVMRLNSPGKRMPGVDRTTEILIWAAVSQAGLAPPVLHADVQAGILITEYVDGASFGRSHIDSALIDRLVRVLEATHRLAVDAPPIDHATRVEEFWRLIDAGQRPADPLLLQQRGSMQALVEEFMEAPGPIGLCHHDPVPANFIDSQNRLYLLDWEYASPGPVVMDYAALCVDWNIDTAAIIQRVGVNPDLLDSAQTIYRYICSLWAEAQI